MTILNPMANHSNQRVKIEKCDFTCSSNSHHNPLHFDNARGLCGATAYWQHWIVQNITDFRKKKSSVIEKHLNQLDAEFSKRSNNGESEYNAQIIKNPQRYWTNSGNLYRGKIIFHVTVICPMSAVTTIWDDYFSRALKNAQNGARVLIYFFKQK